MPSVVQVVRSLVAPVTHTRLFRWIGPRVLPRLERAMKRLTGGRVQVSGLLVPSLVLHSTGAKSARVHDSVLMYTPDGRGRAIVAGTSFARHGHPSWTYNLLAHPDAAITVRGRRLAVRASLIDDADRDAAWRRIERQWPGYRSYERDSGRVVRLFVLQPVREAPATPPEQEETPMTTCTIRSADFSDGDRIPDRLSADGGNDVPSLTLDGVDPSAVELALICHDPDAPDPGGFTHWTVYGIAPSASDLAEAGFREGPNDAGTTSWWGPKPPVGHGTHHYAFTLYALSRTVEGTPTRDEFLEAYGDAILDEATLTGTYSR